MHWRYCSLAISHLYMAVDALFIIGLYIDPATQVTGKSWAYFVSLTHKQLKHDDVIKWRHFPQYWPFARGIHRSPMNSLHKGQWHGALMFFFYLRLYIRLSEQSWDWWFETPLHPLWCHCNEMHGCILSTTASDALVLKHQTISIHSAD